MKQPEIINHRSKEIIYLNFENMKNVDEIKLLEDKGAQLIRKKLNNTALTLTNMEGMFFNNDIRSYFSEVVKGNAPYVKAAAVIGLTGLISVMYSSFLKITGRNIKLFKTKEEALDYLASV